MKAIQVTMDEDLLAELDRSPEVQRDGRSAVVRRAAAEYLRRQKRRMIAEQYRRGYQENHVLAQGYLPIYCSDLPKSE